MEVCQACSTCECRCNGDGAHCMLRAAIRGNSNQTNQQNINKRFSYKKSSIAKGNKCTSTIAANFPTSGKIWSGRIFEMAEMISRPLKGGVQVKAAKVDSTQQHEGS